MKPFAFLTMASVLLASCQSKNTTTHNTGPAPETSASKSLEGTYWVLTELEGKPVAPAAKDEKPSFIYFNAAKKRVAVSGGCNGMGGSYELLEGNRIRFGQMMSTMMACPDMTKEEGLKQMTALVDMYMIDGDNLSFSKARMAPVARFKAMPAPEGFKTE